MNILKIILSIYVLLITILFFNALFFIKETTLEKQNASEKLLILNERNTLIKINFGESPLCDKIECWILKSFSDTKWKNINIHKNKIQDYLDKNNKNQSTVWYRFNIKVPKNFNNSNRQMGIFLGFINLNEYTVFINSEEIFYGHLNNNIDIISLPRKFLSQSDTLNITIKGKFSNSNIGIHYYSDIFIGDYQDLKTIYITEERRNVTVYLFWLLPLLTILTYFILMSLFSKSKNLYLFSANFTTFAAISVMICTKLTSSLGYLLRLHIFGLSKIIQSIMIVCIWNIILKKNIFSKKMILPILISIIIFELSCFDFYKTHIYFNILSILTLSRIIYSIFVLYLNVITLINNYNNKKYAQSIDYLITIFLLVYLLLCIVTWFYPNNDFSFSIDLIFGLIISILSIKDFRNIEMDNINKNKLLKEQERDVAIGKTASLIAHDIRKPFSTIEIVLDNFDLIKNDPIELERSRIQIRNMSLHTNQVLNNIMNFSKNDTITTSPQSIYSLLEKSFKQVILKQVYQKNIFFSFDLKSTRMLEVNESQMTRCLSNLLKNSFEAILDMDQSKDDGFLKISSYLEENTTSPFVVIKIENSGPNIPQERIKNLFNIFQTYEKRNGTGLGLSSVKKCIDLHKGAIYAENCKKGVSFTLKLPSSTNIEYMRGDFFCKSLYEYIHSEKNIIIELISKLIGYPQKINLLILDNELIYINWIKSILKDIPHSSTKIKVYYSTKYKTAQEIITQESIDYAIIDYYLDYKKTGLDFIKENKNHKIKYMLHSNNYDLRSVPFLTQKITKCQKPLSNYDLLNFLCS